MTPEQREELDRELRDEARYESREERYRARRGTVDVDFTVENEGTFSVPAMSGLDFWAIYEVFGEVTPDRSGDHITPNGPPDVRCYLGDLKEYQITLYGGCLPEWLQAHLATEYATEMDAAFLEAIGGQERLDELAIEAAT